MNETKPKKMVSRNVAVALGIICIVLIAIIAYFTVTGISAQNSYNNLQNQNSQLQTWLDGNETLLNQTQTWLNGNVTSLQNQVSNLTNTVGELNTRAQQPESQLVWCGDWQINESSNGGILYWPSNAGWINVGNYETMTVIMNFSNVQWQGALYLTANAYWSSYPNPTDGIFGCQEDVLTSTLYQINSAGVNSISTDCYPIKEPYVYVTPDENPLGGTGNATIHVYVYLSNEATTGSLHKTMSWTDSETGNSTTYDFGSGDLAGFSQVTIIVSSNVTASVTIFYGIETIDNFNLSANLSVVKTYALNGGNLAIRVTPSATPWSTSCYFYVTI